MKLFFGKYSFFDKIFCLILMNLNSTKCKHMSSLIEHSSTHTQHCTYLASFPLFGELEWPRDDRLLWLVVVHWLLCWCSWSVQVSPVSIDEWLQPHWSIRVASNCSSSVASCSESSVTCWLRWEISASFTTSRSWNCSCNSWMVSALSRRRDSIVSQDRW